jgi:hypothetical protein
MIICSVETAAWLLPTTELLLQNMKSGKQMIEFGTCVSPIHFSGF